ncbi:MAG: thiolase family protein [Marivivens sp.]|nr:thiolase family protein [Marivivens sp.]
MTPRIIAARRTIVAPKGGALSGYALHELAAPVMLACLADAGLRPDDVDEVILSNAIGGGGNPARVAALAAGLPDRVAGLSIDRQCAGGLDAIGIAMALVRSGQAKVVLAGGAESHSRRPIRMAQTPDGPVAYDRPAFTPWHDRDPDLAEAANDELDDPFTRRLAPRLVARAPVVTGELTAVNTAVAADAAAFCLVVAEDVLPDRNALMLNNYACVGGDPMNPALAPISAIKAVTNTVVDQVEMMEAYAAQAIACVEGAGIDPRTVNLKGGALARGHPIGASGTILMVRLYHDLAGTNRTGLAAIAAAGGIGSAIKVQGFGKS